MVKKQGSRVIKGRDWAFIVYPDSAPDNWRSIIDDTHLRWIESPLHDKDVNPDGEPKKAHWHIMISYDGPVTIKPVLELAEKLNSPRPIKVDSGRGQIRYFIHLDNPEKYQYPPDEMKAHGGAEIAPYFEQSKSSRLENLKQMIAYIRTNRVDNFAEFMEICIDNEDWFEIASDKNTLVLNSVINAQWQLNQREQSDKKG